MLCPPTEGGSAAVLRSCHPALLAELLAHCSSFSVQFVCQLGGESFCSVFSLQG